MYELLKKDGRAKRGRFTTVHGVIETPVFMNVGTAAAIKGAVSTDDLRGIKTQVELSNTYHLHVRPGDEVVKKLGGLHKFMNWDKPILTDSGGFQVFSLAKLRKIKEEGVHFNSHIDGHKIFMGPEQSMQIQSNLASTIAMAFDECPSSVADRKYMTNSVERTTRWLKRCKDEMARLNSLPDTINPHQMLFGINQGGIYEDIRIAHAQQIAELNLDGYAVGGLAVGESHEEMYRILDAVVPHLPENTHTIDEVGDIRIDQVVIGSCTNGRLDDLRIAAEVLEGRHVAKGIRCIVIPATQKIYMEAMEEGLLKTFIEAGAVVSTPTCGPCLGGYMGVLAEGERCVSTTNRNFVGRMGHVKSEVYLASPAVAAASAVAGQIACPEQLD